MKMQAGDIITLSGADATITKISRMPQMVQRQNQFLPTMRVYYKQGDGRGHFDCEVPQDIEVIF